MREFYGFLHPITTRRAR